MNYRILLYMLSAAILAISALCYPELRGFGFPDGHLTDLDRARAPLYRIFIFLSIVHGAYVFQLGWTAMDRNLRPRFLVAVLSYGLIIIIAISVDYYLGLHLDNGAGG